MRGFQMAHLYTYTIIDNFNMWLWPIRSAVDSLLHFTDIFITNSFEIYGRSLLLSTKYCRLRLQPLIFADRRFSKSFSIDELLMDFWYG